MSRSPDNQNLDVLDDFEDRADVFAISLLASTEDCINVLDTDGGVKFISINGRRAMEIDDFEQVRGAPWPTLWPEAQRGLVQRALGEARNGNTSEFEAVGPTVKGTPKVWAVTVIPILSEAGDVERIIATSRDITDRVELSSALRAKNRELDRRLADVESLLAERDHMIAEVDHRVKNSLTLVSTILRLQQRELAATNQDAAEALETAGIRVLAIARMHEGLQERVDDRMMMVRPYLTNLIGDLQEAMGSKDHLTLDLDPSIRVSGTKASHIGLIAVELVQNARKYRGAQDPEIILSLSVDPETYATATLSVVGKGPGLPEDFRIRDAGRVGLKVCASGAMMLGGELLFENTEDGTRFHVTFPLM